MSLNQLSKPHGLMVCRTIFHNEGVTMKASLIGLVIGCAVASSTFGQFDIPPLTPPHMASTDIPPLTPPHSAMTDIPPLTPPHAALADIPPLTPPHSA
jgi:hypothetical protein